MCMVLQYTEADIVSIRPKIDKIIQQHAIMQPTNSVQKAPEQAQVFYASNFCMLHAFGADEAKSMPDHQTSHSAQAHPNSIAHLLVVLWTC